MNNKNFLYSLLLSVAVLCLSSQFLSAATFGKFTYKVENGEVTITDYDDYAKGAVKIPTAVGGKPVTSIGDMAFQNCFRLKSVTIPGSVTSIGESAFSLCESLESVIIPDSVISIRNAAFSYCSSLESVTIPDSVTSIGEEVFRSCESLKSVTIPDSVTSIGEVAFHACSSLKSVTIPDSVTSIGRLAFAFCDNLESVTIGDRVTSIGGLAFRDCDSLTSFVVKPSNPKYSSSDGLLFDKSQSRLILAPPGITGSLVIPDSITSIGRTAFERCDSLVSVIIPDSITFIGNGMFSGCRNLESVTIPDSVTSIGNKAFSYCTSLESVTIPDSVTSIGNSAFSHCRSLESVAIPDSVTSIGERAFSYCNSLESVTIPDSVTSIGGEAFSYCRSLESVTIGDSVASIGYRAFDNCNRLKSVTIGDNASSIVDAFDGLKTFTSFVVKASSSNYSSVNGILFNKLQTELVKAPAGITGSVIIPDSVTSIGNGAFSYCNRLESVTIGESVTSIGYRAFSYCNRLKSVTIGDNASSIVDAFDGLEAFTSFVVKASSSNYSSVNGILFNKLQTELVKAPAGITGSVIIPDSVTSIGNRAFSYCRSLESVTIGESVTSIGYRAFASCFGLESVAIGESVKFIGDGAFDDCWSLDSILVNDSNENISMINGILFAEVQGKLVKALTKIRGPVNIPDNVTSIADGAFKECYVLKSVTIPDSVTSIGYYAFSGCRSLESMIIPDSVTSIGDGAFSGCISLESVTIPDRVTSIGVEAFRFCRTLKSVTIPNSVMSIGNHAFASCLSLEKVLFEGNSPQIGNGIFEGNERLAVYFTGKSTGFRRPEWTQPTGILREGPEIVVLQSKVNFFDYGSTTVWNPLNEGGSEYNFGASPVGKKRQIKKFMVRNDGTRKLGPLKIIKGGPNKADFSATFSSNQLEAGEFARLTLNFKPSAKGGKRRKATIRIISNDKDERTFDIKVLGKVQQNNPFR